ncbi:MAG: GNAT family N-acetyltransferase [Sphaerochaetaceae bacterium]|jgi:ribosomal-protein-alanine N-acetyltransferase|nr:GNAT family N-acetyltransferase [Sphaerochaetaceae bacterium]
MRSYFLKTARLGFSTWQDEDLPLALRLWSDPQVCRFISSRGFFTEEEIRLRLASEIKSQKEKGWQYWPVFDLESEELVGCCGLRGEGELGFHLRPAFWSKGLGYEAARAAIDYAFSSLGLKVILAGHNPANKASEALLMKLGFMRTGEQYYEPTGLMHPVYEIKA